MQMANPSRSWPFGTIRCEPGLGASTPPILTQLEDGNGKNSAARVVCRVWDFDDCRLYRGAHEPHRCRMVDQRFYVATRVWFVSGVVGGLRAVALDWRPIPQTSALHSDLCREQHRRVWRDRPAPFSTGTANQKPIRQGVAGYNTLNSRCFLEPAPSCARSRTYRPRQQQMNRVRNLSNRRGREALTVSLRLTNFLNLRCVTHYNCFQA